MPFISHRRALKELLIYSQGLRNPDKRYVDLAVRFCYKDGPQAGQLTRPFGGRWDRLGRRYVGLWADSRWKGSEPSSIHTIDIAAQSMPFILDFHHRIQLAVGGRRSGKTTGSLAPKALIMVILNPFKNGMVLSSNYRQSNNVFTAILRHSKPEWIRTVYKSIPRSIYFINGAKIIFLSGYYTDTARSEGVAWGAYDERQDISEETIANAFLSISETDDYYIFETATIKESLREHYDILASNSKARIHHMDSYGNPFIDKTFLDDAQEFLDEATIKREIYAQWPQLYGRVYYPFDESIHVRPYDMDKDSTAQYLYAQFAGTAPQFEGAHHWFISVDPPHTAAIWKIYADGTMHLCHEIIIGVDGYDGDIRTLVKKCYEITGQHAMVVIDPHDRKWDYDANKYFKSQGFRLMGLRLIPREYRITSVRARLEQQKLLISPSCIHAIDVLNSHLYRENEPDKVQRYSKRHAKESKKIQMVHMADAIGYGIYKLFPAKLDYAKMEQRYAA